MQRESRSRESFQSFSSSRFNIQLRIISVCVMIDTESADNATDLRDVGPEEQRPEHAALRNISDAWLLTSG